SSTLDYFGHGFVILAGPDGAGWSEALQDKAWPASDRLPTKFVTIGKAEGDPDGRFATLYGIQSDGVVLVRPDGYVAARIASLKDSSPAALAAAAQCALGR
ncbi:MAG: FAD-dependent monooxygenase, partial [Puniceicoccales bacterium]